MKKEDIKVGMKVVPHQKTARCFEWDFEDYKSSNTEVPSFLIENRFLYVTGFDNDFNAFILGVCSEIKDGDFFAPEDFELYCEKAKDQEFDEEYWV